MKTLIIGASGLIGRYLYREFSSLGEIKGTHLPPPEENSLIKLDIKNQRGVRNLFRDFHPDVMLCTAATSNVEYCEDNPQETSEVNIFGTQNVIEEAKKTKAKFIFFSSEYVFDGRSGPYSEEDMAYPINEYGKQKLRAENIIKEELSDFLIIRTTVVYGWEKMGKNFVAQILRNLPNGKSMKVPYDQISSPTYAKSLAVAIKELTQKNKRGIYNIVGNQTMNRYDFARLVCKVFELNPKLIVPVPTEQLGQKAQRPLRAGLKIQKAEKELETKLFSPEEGLKLMKWDLEQWKEVLKNIHYLAQ